jgi:hypothetical protein
MRCITRILLCLLWLAPLLARGQIDPVFRSLIQLGYNQPVEGKAPVAGYAFYYYNKPNFLETNLTLRLAVAPVYVDSELGFVQGLGPNTDFAIGVAGGGFADDYNEIRGGTFIEAESFDGNSAELSSSVYHRFNPNQEIPLSFVLRGIAHYSMYNKDDNTANNFELPNDGPTFDVRTGLRYGGIEPTLFPALAMELAVWYEGEFRGNPGGYGFVNPNGDFDRELEPSSHLFWGSAALSYTFDKTKQNFFIRMVFGTSVDADRLSGYRLGGFLPLVAEYPLSLPGFMYQEISARQFVLANGSYLVPIAPNQRWNLEINAATAVVDYLPGTEQPGNWLSGVGAGLLYRSPSDRLKVALTYGYGIDAIRDSGRGANSVGILMQWDLEKTKGQGFKSVDPNRWQGWNWIMGR